CGDEPASRSRAVGAVGAEKRRAAIHPLADEASLAETTQRSPVSPRSRSMTLRTATLLTGSFILLALATSAVPAKQDKKENTAAKAQPRDGPWMKRHTDLVAEAKKGGIDLLLLGDAATDEWTRPLDAKAKRGGKAVYEKDLAPFKPANFGIGGDKT